MKEITICEVKGKRDLAQFIDIPWQLYSSDPVWVPPLKLAEKSRLDPRHPFFQTTDIKKWMALSTKNGKRQILGRVVAMINHAYNEFHSEKRGFFGLFESIDDERVATALFDAAAAWPKERGMDTLCGPVNLSTNYESGLLVEGRLDPPQIMMTYNHAYYPKLMESWGFKKAKDLHAYRVTTDIKLPSVIKQISQRIVDKSNFSIRQLDKSKWDEEIARIKDVYNSAWEKNWGFVPMTDAEFDHMAKEMKSIVEEKLVWFVEDGKETVGFFLALPDYHQVFKRIPSGRLLPFGIFKLLRGKKYIDRVRLTAMGIKANYRHRGVETLLYLKGLEGILNIGGIKEIEISWILEDNFKALAPLKRMNAQHYKTYRLYEKSI